MAKPLLRSGKLDDFYALGENGQSLFELAQQIRETLRLRKQQDLLRSLAIPQLNERESRVNWFAPMEGEVVSWAAAEAHQQRAALAHLETCAAALTALAQQYQASQDAAARLFAALLPHILYFPGSQFVYLVGGVPVITFWGFTAFDAPPGQAPLAPLRAALKEEPEPVMAAPLAAAPATEEQEEAEAVVVSLSQQPAVEITPPAGRSAFRFARRAIAGVMLAACSALFFWPQLSARFLPTPPSPAIAPLPAIQPPFLLVRALPALEKVHLPLAAAALTPPVVAPVSHPDAVQPPNALQLPADDVRLGSTRFFDGKWRISARQHAEALHGISAFRLTIAQDRGVAQMIAAPRVSCQVSVKSGLMQSGNLVVKSQGKARCTNGTRVPVPDIICNRNAEGATLCNADYGDSAPVAVTLRKVKE